MTKLRYYETFFLVRPDLTDQDRQSTIEKFKSIITDHKGLIAKVDPWPLQKLAYPVQKFTQGYYVLLEYASTPDVIMELTRKLRLDEAVLKFITLKKSDDFDPSKVSYDEGDNPEQSSEDTDSSGAETEDKTEATE